MSDFRIVYDLKTLIDEFTEDEIIKAINSIKTSPYANRFRVSFSWFLKRENFDKLYKDLAKN